MIFLLIDFENVQPKSLATLRGRPMHLKIFVGSQQAKVPFELAQTVQALGPQAEYVQIAGSGRNALDLHIAYYIGRLAAQHADAQFYIFSKDRDYDVLIKHLHATGVSCKRTATLDDIPLIKAAPAPQKAPAAPRVENDPLSSIIKYLRNLKAARPRKLKTLESTLRTRAEKAGGNSDVPALIEELKKRGIIQISGAGVTYQLEG